MTSYTFRDFQRGHDRWLGICGAGPSPAGKVPTKPILLMIAASMAAAIAVQAASAQLATGRSGSSTAYYLDSNQVWAEVGEFGRCYASQSRAAALALIATEPGSQHEAETYRRMFRKPYQACLGDVTYLNAAHFMVRGAIAEGLYKAGLPIPTSLALPVPPEGARIRNISEAARCYTARHPERVRELLADTKPGSRKEFSAITALMPDFAQCLPEAAQRYQYDATQVRFRLAEALLRTVGSMTTSAGTK